MKRLRGCNKRSKRSVTKGQRRLFLFSVLILEGRSPVLCKVTLSGSEVVLGSSQPVSLPHLKVLVCMVWNDFHQIHLLHHRKRKKWQDLFKSRPRRDTKPSAYKCTYMPQTHTDQETVREVSLMVQWLRIYLAMQGIRVHSLVGELSLRAATKTHCSQIN